MDQTRAAQEYASAVPEWWMAFDCPNDPKAAVQFSISVSPSEQGQPILSAINRYLRCMAISGGA